VDLDRLATCEDLVAWLRPVAQALAALPACRLDDIQVGMVREGRPLDASRLHLDGAAGPGDVAMMGPDGTLVGIGTIDPARTRVAPRKVFPPSTI
jgi:tRNA U55 pseudouridine synthase TruB